MAKRPLVAAEEAPAGDGWCHEIKLDGYRMHARVEGGEMNLLTRTGLDWSRRRPIGAHASVGAALSDALKIERVKR